MKKQFVIFSAVALFLAMLAIAGAVNYFWSFEKTFSKSDICTENNTLCLNGGKCGASPYTCEGSQDKDFYFHKDLINHYSEQLFKIDSDKSYNDCNIAVEINLSGASQAKEDFLYKLNEQGYYHFYDPGFEGTKWVTLPENFSLNTGSNFLHFKSPEFCKTVWQRNAGQTEYGSVHLYNVKIQCGKTEIPPEPQDTTAPEITVYSPVSNKFYNTKNISLEVSANEQAEWKYSLNSADKVSFEPNTTITGEEGQNTLVVYATDNAGNTAQEQVVFYVDTTMPIINILSPENKTYGSQDILVKFTTQDENLVSSWFFNETTDVYSNEAEQKFSEGSHTIKFYAKDKAGNVAVKTVSFTVKLPEEPEEEEKPSVVKKCTECELALQELEESVNQTVVYKNRGVHIEPPAVSDNEKDSSGLFGLGSLGIFVLIFLIVDVLLLIVLSVVVLR